MNFYIEANIGAGKSTLVKNVAKKLRDVFAISVQEFLEPTERWENTPQGNILALYGADQKTYAFITQTLIMATFAEQRQNMEYESGVRIFERGLDSARFIFQNLMEEQGLLTPLDSYTLNSLYGALKSSQPQADGVIYIKVDPDVAFARAMQRATGGDLPLQKQYFHDLGNKHEEFLSKMGTDVLTLDGTKEPMELAMEAAQWIFSKLTNR